MLGERTPCPLERRPDLERAVSALAEDRLLERVLRLGGRELGLPGRAFVCNAF
jgi:hypothetical protein